MCVQRESAHDACQSPGGEQVLSVTVVAKVDYSSIISMAERCALRARHCRNYRLGQFWDDDADHRAPRGGSRMRSWTGSEGAPRVDGHVELVPRGAGRS